MMARQEITGLHKLELFVEPWNGGPERVRLESPIRLGKETDLWGARDPEGRPWAVRLLPQYISAPGEWDHLERLSRVRHPQVVWVMGKVEAQSRSGIVREWVRGTSLDQIWRPGEDVSLIEEVFRNVLAAIREVHRAGVVHGGLKPARVFLDRDKRTVKVVDFGLSTWLPPRQEDAPWLAPEQRTRYTPDERGDIYSLGALLYWLASGEAPAPAPVPLRRLRPDLPAGMLRAVEECMRPDREQRLGSCALLLDLIGEGATNRPIYQISESFPTGLEDASAEESGPDQTFDEALDWDEGADNEPSLLNRRDDPATEETDRNNGRRPDHRTVPPGRAEDGRAQGREPERAARTDARGQDARIQEVKEQIARAQHGRPEQGQDRSQDKGDRPQSKGDKAQDNKAQDNKAQDNKAQDNKAQDNKAQGNKAQDNKAQGNKAQGNKAQERPPEPAERTANIPGPGHRRQQITWMIVAIILGTVIGVGGALAWRLTRPPPPLPEEAPEVPVAPPPPTVPTFFEFAGSTQPGSVVISCPGGYQQQVAVAGGRAVVDSVPSVNGCLMYPKGVTVDRPVSIKQGGGYACVVDRGVLTCRPIATGKGR